MAESITTLTMETFHEVIGSSELPIAVDFWAEWCGPCKMIAPILEEIAVEKADVFKVAKLNVDDAHDIALEYQVMSIPTLIVFVDGEPMKRIVGAKGKQQLLQEIGDVAY